MKMPRRFSLTPYLFLMPVVIVLLVLTIYPLIFSLWNSFHMWYLGRPHVKPFVGLSNYVNLILYDTTFRISLINTAIIAAVAIPIELGLGLLLAVLIYYERPKGERIFRTVLILPMLASPVVVGVLWRFLYHPNVGLINYILESTLGIGHVNFLGDPNLALMSVILVDIWQWTSFMFLIFLAGLFSLPIEVTEAALIDGASGLPMFRYVTLPLIRPLLTLALIFRTMDVVKLFDIVYVMTRGGPGSATDTLTLYAFRQGLVYFQMGTASALSFIIAIIITIITMIFFRLLGRELA